MDTLSTILKNAPEIISALVGVLTGLGVLFALIPGEQPEATLKKISDFIAKFSRK